VCIYVSAVVSALAAILYEGSRDKSLGVFPRTGEAVKGGYRSVRKRDYEGVMDMKRFIVEPDIHETGV
jgi:hypothetical protein